MGTNRNQLWQITVIKTFSRRLHVHRFTRITRAKTLNNINHEERKDFHKTSFSRLFNYIFRKESKTFEATEM